MRKIRAAVAVVSGGCLMSNAFVRPQDRDAVTPTGAKTFASHPAKSPTFTRTLRRLRDGASLIGLATTSLLAAQSASAQTTPAPNIVGACSGVSLPRSVVTDILSPVVTGIANPVQSTVNPILSNVKSISGVLTVSVLGLPPLVANLPSVPTPALSIDVAGILNDAANNAPLTLSVLNSNGVAVGPNDSCVTQADGFTLRTPAGIAIGGNRITGLGANGFEAFAADPNAIAFGNSARTGAGAVGAIAFGGQAQVADNATGAIALGTGASATAANGVALGAGSVSSRAAATGYTAIGLAVPQNSAGEVSVGAAGAERQITNVAAGTAATDA
ncbi:MAG: hypothetical protein EOP67_75320, partial [Sphingomonas sp.]